MTILTADDQRAIVKLYERLITIYGTCEYALDRACEFIHTHGLTDNLLDELPESEEGES